LPSFVTYLLVFILGVIFTAGFQIIAYFYYALGKAEEFSIEEPETPRKVSIDVKEIKPVQTSPQKFELGKFLIRKFSVVQCFCTSDKFSALFTGNDPSLDDLLAYFKEILNAKRRFASGLVRIGEVRIIEQIKSDKFMKVWKFFRGFCLEIGKFHLNESENLLDSLSLTISKNSKENEKKMKDIKAQIRQAGEKFNELTSESQKIIPKLSNLTSSLTKASQEFDEVKKDLAKFETLVKKEMKLKKINNEIQILKIQLSKVNESLSTECKSYLPKANLVLQDFSSIQKSIAGQYKSFMENWLGFEHKLINFSIEKLEKIIIEPEEERKSLPHPSLKQTMSFFKKALTKSETTHETLSFSKIFSSFTSNDSQNSAFRLAEGKSSKLELKVSELKKFLNIIQTVQEDLQKDLSRVVENWKIIQNYYIEDSLSVILKQLREMFCNNSEFINGFADCFQLISEFSEKIEDFRQESFAFESTSEDLQKAEVRYKDLSKDFLSVIEAVKSKTVICFRNWFHRLKNHFETIVPTLEVVKDREEPLSFSHQTKDHAIRCPYFSANFQETFDSALVAEPQKTGNPESAVWLNDLLRTFIFEWKNSPRFIKYMCNKLKKGFNKDNPEYIGEIEVNNIEVGHETPEIKDLVQLEAADDEFLYEFDLWFRGDVKIELEFELKFSVAAVSVNVKVVLRSFYAKLRFFYAKSCCKPSWYSFVSEPVHQISLEPVLGKMNKIALNKIPQINSVLVSMLAKKIRKYVWPHKRAIKIFKGLKSTVPLK
jgi:hypothetical protein